MSEVGYEVIYEVVTNLIGDIKPVGETRLDILRKNNLKTHIQVMNMLVDDVLFLIEKRDNYECSIKEIGELSYKELKNLTETLSECLEDDE